MRERRSDQRQADGLLRVELREVRTRFEELRWIGAFVWGILSVSPSEYRPACDVVVVNSETGEEVLRHTWGANTESATFDIRTIEAAIETMTMAEFYDEYSIGDE